jgi:hypothetical protein
MLTLQNTQHQVAVFRIFVSNYLNCMLNSLISNSAKRVFNFKRDLCFEV